MQFLAGNVENPQGFKNTKTSFAILRYLNSKLATKIREIGKIFTQNYFQWRDYKCCLVTVNCFLVDDKEP